MPGMSNKSINPPRWPRNIVAFTFLWEEKLLATTKVSYSFYGSYVVQSSQGQD